MSTNVTAMAAQFTEVSLDEMVKYLQRAFHALEPQRQINVRGELAIDLPLSEKVSILVFTSIGFNSAQAAGLGEDAIRVGLFRGGRPLKPGKLPIVKRTQGWKNTLRDKIEEAMEIYDERSEEIERGDFIKW